MFKSNEITYGVVNGETFYCGPIAHLVPALMEQARIIGPLTFNNKKYPDVKDENNYHFRFTTSPNRNLVKNVVTPVVKEKNPFSLITNRKNEDSEISK